MFNYDLSKCCFLFQVNKCTTAVRIVIDPSELPMCDCSASNESPCGPESNCLNRMLQFECYPQRCPGKENCQNQRFQKRQYVDCEPFRTLHRGWGLRCKEGEMLAMFFHIATKNQFRG